MTREDAIRLLCNLFDDNKLSFRNIALLKKHFDEAVEACNEGREEMEADHCNGCGAFPTLPSRDVEEDFLSDTACTISNKLKAKGVIASGKALQALAEITADETDLEDFYYEG